MIEKDELGYNEREKELNWAAAKAGRDMKEHRQGNPIDHPDGSVTHEKLADGSVGFDKIAEESISGTKLMDGAVTSDKIASEAISRRHIQDREIQRRHLCDGIIGEEELEDDAVTEDKLSENVRVKINSVNDETIARQDADNALDKRLKSVESTSHTHGNKAVLDGLSAADVKKWNGMLGNTAIPVWQDDFTLEWHNANTEVLEVSYNTLNDTAIITLEFSGALIANGAAIWNDSETRVIEISHKHITGTEYKTVMGCLELSTGRIVTVNLTDFDSFDMTAEYNASSGYLFFGIGYIAIYHEESAPWVSYDSGVFKNEIYDLHMRVAIPALHQHGDIIQKIQTLNDKINSIGNADKSIVDYSVMFNILLGADAYIKLSEQVNATYTLDHSNRYCSIEYTIPALVICFGDKVINIDTHSSEATIRGNKYIYHWIELRADGSLDYYDYSYYDSADKNSITELENGGYRIEFCIGSGYYIYEPGPYGEPAGEGNFTAITDTVVLFRSENGASDFLASLITDTKESLSAAVNEVKSDANTLKQNVSSLGLTLQTMNSLLGTLSSELDAVNGVAEE